MPDFVPHDRVKEITRTTGTDPFSLLGPVTGYQSFAVGGNNSKCFYCAEAVSTDGKLIGPWEIGIGTYTASSKMLSRDAIIASSDSGLIIPFDSGVKNVFKVDPAAALKSFAPAGSLYHYPGSVPDAGAATHDPPWFLGDDAQWHEITIQSGYGPPDPATGVSGSIYFDITDPSNPQFYYKR